MLRATPLLGLLVLALCASPVVHAGVVVKIDPTAVAPDDRSALEALARLPDETRRVALEAALHVPLLEEIAELHAETSVELEALVEGLPVSQRDSAWALLSHPELLASRGGEAPSDEAEWKATVAELPPELLASALTLMAYEPDFFARIASLRADVETRFEALLAPHPIETQAIFRALLPQPDVLGLLTTHLDLAAVLGSRYRDDPANTAALLASLGESLARGDDDALPGWNELEPDPRGGIAHEAPAPATWPATLIASVMPIFTGSAGAVTRSWPTPAPRFAPSSSFWFGGRSAMPSAPFASHSRGIRFDRPTRSHDDSWRSGLAERHRDGTLRRERGKSRHERRSRGSASRRSDRSERSGERAVRREQYERRLRDSHESRDRHFERMRDRSRRGFDSNRGRGSIRYGKGEVRRGQMNAGRARRGQVKRAHGGGGHRGP